MPFLADRLARVKPSPTMAMTALATELKAAGRDIISLSVGRARFRHAGQYPRSGDRGDAARRDPLHCVRRLDRAEARGLRQVQARERARLRDRRRSRSARAASRCSTTRWSPRSIPGTRSSSRRRSGCPIPRWCCCARATPVPVPCPQNNGFKMRPEDLDAAITPRTKWLILNSPSNPSGAAYTEADLKACRRGPAAPPACLGDDRRHVRAPRL